MNPAFFAATTPAVPRLPAADRRRDVAYTDEEALCAHLAVLLGGPVGIDDGEEYEIYAGGEGAGVGTGGLTDSGDLGRRPPHVRHRSPRPGWPAGVEDEGFLMAW